MGARRPPGPRLALSADGGVRRRVRAGWWAAPLAAALVLAGCGTPGPTTVRADGWVGTLPGLTARTAHARTVTWTASAGDETDAVSVATGTSGAGLAAAVDAAASALGGTVLARRSLTWLGRPAEAAAVATTDRLVRLQLVQVGDRRYTLVGISRAATPRFPGFERLLRSFRLTGG